MVAVSCRTVASNVSGGKRLVEVFIVADTTPEVLPTTGETVIGLSADDIFAPMSVLYVVGAADIKVYITNEKGLFVPQ